MPRSWISLQRWDPGEMTTAGQVGTSGEARLVAASTHRQQLLECRPGRQALHGM